MPLQLDPARNHVWRLFLTAYARLVRQVEYDLQAAGLPPLEWYDVLIALKQAPDQRLRLSDLATTVLISRTNLTRLVDLLEKADLVNREPCPEDRRGSFAVLTKVGIAMQQKMWMVYARSIGQNFGRHLNETDVEAFRQSFSAMLAAIKGIEGTD